MRIENLINSDSNVQEPDIQEFVPGANLELIIEGLVLMYEKDGKLMMRLPDATDHTLRIDITKNGLNYFGFSVPVGSHIEIGHIGATSTMNNIRPDVLDVRRSLHAGLRLNANPTNRRSLSISDALITPYVDPNFGVIRTRFEYWEVRPVDGYPVQKIRNTGFEADNPNGIVAAMMGGVVINPATANAHTKITVTGAVPFETRLNYENNSVRYKMKISNHCQKPDCELRSDFHHYYKMFAENSLGAVGKWN